MLDGVLPVLVSAVVLGSLYALLASGLSLIWSTLGTAAWSSALAIAGYVLGQQFEEIEKVVGPLSMAVIAAIVAAYAWRQLTWRKRHPKN